jgi:hypothetical protein
MTQGGRVAAVAAVVAAAVVAVAAVAVVLLAVVAGESFAAASFAVDALTGDCSHNFGKTLVAETYVAPARDSDGT